MLTPRDSTDTQIQIMENTLDTRFLHHSTLPLPQLRHKDDSDVILSTIVTAAMLEVYYVKAAA